MSLKLEHSLWQENDSRMVWINFREAIGEGAIATRTQSAEYVFQFAKRALGFAQSGRKASNVACSSFRRKEAGNRMISGERRATWRIARHSSLIEPCVDPRRCNELAADYAMDL